MIKPLFSRRWIWTTLLAVAAVGVMIRLGIWQLDRLEQRRAFNSHYLAEANQAPLELVQNTLDADLESMEYRQVIVRGEFDHQHEAAIRNQSWDNQPGVHLLTPLKIEGTEMAVLVDRGWIPLEDYQTGNWEGFSEPGMQTIQGVIRLSQTKPSLGGRPDPTPAPGEFARAWNFIHIPAISQQIPYPVLPVYIQQSPESGRAEMPYRSQPEIEISEGPHMGYAIQWFLFASILGIGYPLFVRRETGKGDNKNA